MSNLISRKKEKAFALFARMNTDEGEERFVELFRDAYPGDWMKIVKRYEEEELATKPGKKHSMPEPEVYLREMYRNMLARWMWEGRG